MGGTHGACFRSSASSTLTLLIAAGTALRLELEPGLRRFDRGGLTKPFARGGALCVCPDPVKKEAARYFGWLRDQKIAVAEMPAAFLSELAEYLAAAGGRAAPRAPHRRHRAEFLPASGRHPAPDALAIRN